MNSKKALCSAIGTAAVLTAVCAENIQGINVLTLGVKNDGSEDISSIVNRETEKNALYFPAGIYKVEKPVYLKNPIFGAGYSRSSQVNGTRTWLVSKIKNKDGSVGVLNICRNGVHNIENLNIQCSSQECGIRINEKGRAPYTLIDKVGIYNVRSYGVFIYGQGSRPFFLQNMTIFGASDWSVPCVGIHMQNFAVDNRLTNIEIMGCRISMELFDGFNYGSDLHLWTGCMGGKDNGTWWRGTRSVVLENSAVLNAANIYPDTSFYALETRDERSSFHLQNIFYWEDGSTGGSPDFDGAFFHGPGMCMIDGGEIYVAPKSEKNGRMQTVRMPGTGVKNVVIRTTVPVAAENIDKLCAGNELPDYMLEYTEKGFCKAADILLASPTGCTESILSLENGEAYRIQILRAENGKAESSISNLNPLCRKNRVRIKETAKDVFSVYVRNTANDSLKLRFRTETMGEKFRPLHYGLLRSGNNGERNKQVLQKL